MGWVSEYGELPHAVDQAPCDDNVWQNISQQSCGIEGEVWCGGLNSLLELHFILLTQSILEQMTCLLIYTIKSAEEQYYSLTFSKYNQYIASTWTIKSKSLACHWLFFVEL